MDKFKHIDLKTSQEWYQDIKDTTQVLDPDGWNRKDFQYSWYEELISHSEFNNRVMNSTVRKHIKEK